MRRNKIIRWFFNRLYRLRPPELVQYWKKGDVARAKLTVLKDGSYAMVIEGEKYPLYGFPRGPVLFGALARLKFLAKNLVFNETWKLLEEGKTNEEVMAYIKNVALPEVLKEVSKNKYDFFPPERMCPAVRELWRALSSIGKRMTPEAREQFDALKQGITFFLQEDDAYKLRVQFLAKFINPRSWYRKIYRLITRREYSFKKEVETLLGFLGEAEITPDMKGRAKLIKRVLLAFLEDEEFGELIEAVVWEVDWKKMRLSRSDLYYLRGKFFKTDYAVFDY